jgi:hypothetical protein
MLGVGVSYAPGPLLVFTLRILRFLSPEIGPNIIILTKGFDDRE